MCCVWRENIEIAWHATWNEKWVTCLSPCHVYKDFYLHHCVEVKFLEFHLDANNAEIKQKENKNSVGDCWSPWWWQLMARRERERGDRSRIVESEGLQWASHGTRLAASCSEIYTSDYHQQILTVGPLRTSWRCPDSWMCLISKLSFVGVSSQGITFCIGNWISHDHHLSVTGEESTTHAGTVDGKNCTLCYVWWFRQLRVGSESQNA